MHVVVSGATGFVGRALVLHLASRGDQVTALVRDPGRALAALGREAGYVPLADGDAVARAIEAADAVVHLAGAAIVGKRWTARRKRELTASRLDTARELIAAIRRRSRPLPVFVSASAVGYYGDRGDEVLPETATRGTGFAAELCEQWEAVAAEARGAAQRVAWLRLGIVLGRHGGALEPLARIARAGLAGPIAGGRQWVPWIHLEDAARAIGHVLATDALAGPINLVAPAPVRQRELAATIARTLGRTARVPVPRFALAAVLGEAASVLLASQRAVPTRLLETGFRHRYPELAAALADLLRDDPGVAIHRLAADEAPHTTYLAAHRPSYALVASAVIERPLEEVMSFFASAENLALLTPPNLAFAIETAAPIEMHEGTTIDYTIKLSGLPMTWRTVIEHWEPGRRFVDAQHAGPYRAWWHEHRFRRDGDRTVMDDVVYYAPPLGPLGRIANRLFVARMLRDIFSYRNQSVRLRFA